MGPDIQDVNTKIVYITLIVITHKTENFEVHVQSQTGWL